MRFVFFGRTIVLAALLSLFTIQPGAAQTTPTPPASSSQPTSLLVKFVPALSAAEEAAIIARNGGIEISVIPALRLHVIAVPTSDVTTILANYAGDPAVEHAEENKTRVSETIPSDPLYGNQWALPKIGWDAVFGTVTPAGTARVAILDTGIDGRHSDLIGNVLPGISILDGSDGLTDPSGHGTWLAGIIAARTDTTPLEGIAGVGYTGVQVMPVTVLNANGEGLDSDVIAGVIWAADRGADVILMAFSNAGFSPNLQDAIDYAWSKGAVLVAAVGNNASTNPTFPAGDRGVMGVAATDTTDGLAYFSNDGQAVFIAAPGVDIQTTDIGDAYTVVSGTSTSAAIVAGAAALMKAVDPTLTNGIIVGRLARNADPAGTQAQTGNGRVNLPRALADTSTDPVQPAGAAPVGDGGPFVGPYKAAGVNITVSPASTAAGVSATITVSGGGNWANNADVTIKDNNVTQSAVLQGTSNPCKTPGNGGWTCTYTISPTQGTHTVVASTTSDSATNTYVAYGPVNAGTSTVSASATSVIANGSTTSTITVTLKDSTNNAISGKAVSLAAGSGSSTITTVSGTTNATGQATFTVKDTVVEAVTYTATDTTDAITITQTATVDFTVGPVSGSASTVSANPTSVTADGSTTSTITVTLKDATSHPVSGKTVSLTAGSGSSTIATVSGTTDVNGQATFAVKDAVAQSVVYTARDTTDNISVTQTATVTFTAGAVSDGQSTVSASPTSVVANGAATSTITVTLRDANNNPVSGKAVSLSAGSGSSTITTVSGITNASGQATFTVKDTVVEAVTYTATDTTDAITITQTATVNFTVGPVTANASTVSANPTSVPADGSTTSTITVTLKDATSHAVSGKAVSLTAGSGSSTITTVNGTTDANGQATFTVKDAVAQSVVYTARDTTDGITITQTATVTFTVGAASKLGFGQQPTTTTVGQVISPVTVQVQDSTGNLVTTDNGRSVAVAIGTNPSGGTLSGTTSATTVNGVATFSSLSIDKAGAGYTLTASSSGLTGATSSTFTINNPAPTLTSISPTQAGHPANGQSPISLNVIFTGSNFVTGATASFAGNGITVNSTTVNSSTQLTANISISSNANETTRNVTVTNPLPGGAADTLQNAFTIVANAPTQIAANNASVTVNEGQLASNTGTWSDSDTATSGVTLSASIGTVTKGGTSAAGTWSWSFTTSDGPAQSQTVTITANDGTTPSSTTFTLTVNNVAPTATFNAPGTVTAGNPIALSLTSPSDPSSVDTAAGFQYAFDCGDGGGYGAFGSSNSASCPTSNSGTRSVKGKIQDKDGGSTEYTATVTITPNAANAGTSTVSASPTSVVADGSTTSTITVTLKDVNGNPVSGKAVSLTAGSGSSTITTVSGTTNASGQASFTVKNTVAQAVTYTATDTTDNVTVTQTATVIFTPGPLDHFAISPVSSPQTAGAPFNVSITAQDANNNTVTGFTSTVQLTSNFTLQGAPVTSGAFTAGVLGAQSVTITSAQAGTTLTASAAGRSGTSNAFTVTAGTLDHLVVSPASATMTAGGSQAYTATGFDAFGNSLGDVTAGTIFSISPDGSCVGATCSATVASAHTVTGTNSGKTGTASLTVNAAALDHLVLNPASATITAGGSQAYTATGVDAFGNSLGDVTAGTIFSISPNGSCLGATCSATVAGAHTVTGTNSGKTGTASLTVNAGALDHLVLSPASSSIAAGGSQSYTAEGRDQFENTLGDVTAGTTFLISPDGSCGAASCSAVVAGLHTVTGTNSGKTGTASLTVNAAALDHLILSPASASITAGGSQSYTAEGRDQFENTLGDVTTGTTFSISPDGSCTGSSCTATVVGTHTVTGTKDGKTGSASLQVEPAALHHFAVTGTPGTSQAGTAFSVTVTAQDAYNNTVPSYTGQIHFTSIDGQAVLPGDYTLVGRDNGVHTFTNAVTLKTAGSQTVSVNDTTTITIIGTSDAILVTPAAAVTFSVTAPTNATAGASFDFTVTAKDAYNNVATGYVGTVHFTSNDPHAELPLDYTFQATDNGTHTFFNGAILKTSGMRTITAIDTVTASITGTSGSIHVDPAGAATLSVTAPATATAGTAFDVTVTVKDAFDNVVTGYLGTVHFTSSDASAVLPANYTFLVGDAGTHTFTGEVTLKTASTQTVTATDTVTASITGTSGTIMVDPGALDHLTIAPEDSTILAGGSQSYTAEAFDAYNNSRGDVTSTTTFSITPNGSCTDNVCTVTVAGAHTVTAGKDGKTVTASLTVNPAALDHLDLSPASATIAAGDSQAYTAIGRDQYGNSRGDVTATTTFSITPNGSCTGASCTATVAGAHTVTGTYYAKAATASLQVNAGPLDHIVVSPATASITAGGSQSYTAEAFDSFNNSRGDVTAGTTFSITPNGSCTGASCTATVAGAHTVTGTYYAKTATASLQVNAGPLDHIVVSPASATITAGGSQAYTVEAFDAYNNSRGDVTAGTTFSITPNGSCTGASCTATVAGAHTVTGAYDAKTATASLQVNAGALDHIVVSPATATITAGGNQAYTAEAFDAYNNSRGDVTAGTTFSITPNGSCIGASCTATVAGGHTVSATYDSKTATASLQVSAGPLDHIMVSPATATISAGGSQSYTAEAFDVYNNSRGDVTAGTTFSITPNGSCTGASCTATVAGAHTVTGTYDAKTATASLQVSAGPLDHIVVSPATATITAGGSQAYTAEAFDAYNNSRGDVTAGTTFSMTPNGTCTGASCTATVAGAHTVTGTYYAKTATASLQVNAGALDHIVVSPATATITAGGSQAYTAEAFDVYNNSRGDVTAGTTFSISPNGTCTGASCTATVAGTHAVTGTYYAKTATASLQVNAGALDHIVVSPATATITAGGSQAYTVEAFDAYNNSRGDVTAGTTFSITPNGTCTGASCTATVAGAHTVTGTYDAKTATASLQVNVGPLHHLVLSPASATITAGGSQAYISEGRDQYENTLGDMTSSTTFSISPNGACTGANCTATTAGAHTVTATKDGKTGTASLTVNPAALDHLDLSPSSAAITAGGSQAYTALGRDQYNNSLGDMTAGTTFSISPNGSCPGASCTATIAGAHIVTGTSGGKTGTASLQVNAGALDHLVLSPATATITAGGSQAYTAEGFDQYNNTRGDVTAGTTFSITPNGSCTGASCTATVAGAHTVTGTYYAKAATASLQVNAGALHHLTLSPGSAAIMAGSTQNYAAEGRDQYENSLGDMTGTTTFTIGPDGSCAGTSCTASIGGTHTVTGTTSGKAGTASLQVNYGFVGLQAPYAPPSDKGFKIKSAIPLKWQYTNSSNVVVPSPNAAPTVAIISASCVGVDGTQDVVVADAGNSGYQYDATTYTWQYNWKTTGLLAGCYNIRVNTGQTGQTVGPFLIQLVK